MSASGILQPAFLPFPNNSYDPRTAAIAITNDNISKQTELLNIARGGKTRGGKTRGGKTRGGSTIQVPLMPTIYPNVGANGQTIYGNMLNAAKLNATITANNMYDQCLGQGASCTTQLQSGGLKKTRKYKKRKHRKTRKTHKTRKI